MHGPDPAPVSPAPAPAAPASPASVRPAGSAEAVVWRNRCMLVFDRVQNPLAVCRIDGTILLTNPAMAAQWNAAPGSLPGRNALDLFRPRGTQQLERLTEALRLGRRSRYLLEVVWCTAGERRRGELTVDPVSEHADEQPALLVQLRMQETAGSGTEPRPAPAGAVSPTESRILALAASGATTATIAAAVGITVDGVNYHLTQLSKRWGVRGRTALVAHAYVFGVLDPAVWPPAPAHG